MIQLSVVIPAYNEEGRLPRTLERLRAYLGQGPLAREHEIVVVDDGSRDSTSAVAAAQGATVVRNDTNRGKGFAARRGGLVVVGERGGVGGLGAQPGRGRRGPGPGAGGGAGRARGQLAGEDGQVLHGEPPPGGRPYAGVGGERGRPVEVLRVCGLEQVARAPPGQEGSEPDRGRVNGPVAEGPEGLDDQLPRGSQQGRPGTGAPSTGSRGRRR